MLEAIRRHMEDSEGMSWRPISFPSSRTVSSLEKLVTSMKLQKLPRVNSTATEQSKRWLHEADVKKTSVLTQHSGSLKTKMSELQWDNESII